MTVLAFFSTRISTCSPSLVLRNWLLLYFSVNHLSAIISSIFASFLPCAVRLRSCWHGEYKPQYSPNIQPLTLKVPVFTWSVQWLLPQCVPRLCNAVWSRLHCWAQWHWYFTQFKLFYFPNIIGLVQRIVRFVMRTEPKASYRTVQYEYAYCYTLKIYKHIIYTDAF